MGIEKTSPTNGSSNLTVVRPILVRRNIWSLNIDKEENEKIKNL